MEQNERSRLNLELDLLGRLRDCFESRYFLSRRRRAAAYATDGFAAEGDIARAGRFNRAAYDVANFFEDFERLDRLLADLERERGIEPLTQARVLWIMKDEATIGEESPMTEG